ncbi:MAG: pilus assembly protein TadG-related protein [Anaerolineaceae bacterium]
MYKNEKGQIIVILAVALVAILGVTALAVDGSMIYAERRNDQSTSDSSALSAAQTASANPTCATARTAAINQAIAYASAQEGVALANDTTSPNRVEATCNADNTKLTIKVVVTSNTPTTFAQMVSRDQLTTTVESTSQVSFGYSAFAGGNGLVTLGENCDTSKNVNSGGIHLYANAILTIKGGGAYSRSCVFVDNAPAALMTDGADILYAGKGANTFYSGSQIQYTGTNGIIFRSNTTSFMVSDPSLTMPSTNYQIWGNKAPYTANPAIAQNLWPVPTDPLTFNLDIPDMVPQTCGGTDYGAVDVPYSAVPVTLYPGIYTSINQGWADIIFSPGVYCIRAGGNVTLGGKSVTANNTYWNFLGNGNFSKTGAGYTLYLDNSSVYLKTGNFSIENSAIMVAHGTTIFIEQGNFTASGDVPVVLTAPDCSITNCTLSHGISGVALYLKDQNNLNNTSITIEGSSSMDLSGTIFAPKSKVAITGYSGLKTLQSQIICRRFETTGSSPVTLDIEGANLYGGGSSIPTIELLK